MAKLGDDQIVQAAKDGRAGALEELLRRTYQPVYAVCRRLTGNDTDAEDVTQDALVSIVRNIARFDGTSRFSTWAYRIAYNSSIDELRRRRRRPAPAAEPLEESSRGRNGFRTTMDVEHRIDVDAALASLPADARAAVVLRDMCDLDYAEIAEVLDVPGGTVRSRISRGRAALVAMLEENDRAPATDRTSDHPEGAGS